MRLKYTVSFVSIGLLVLVGFQNCAKSQVGFAEDESSNTTHGGNDPFEVVTKTYSVDTHAQDLDIVWTFDNSGSMDEEAAHMNSNFLAFANLAKSQFNVKIALINRLKSPAYNRNNVAMPSGLGPENVAVDYFVDSYNGMLLTAAATCPSVPASGDSFCEGVSSNSRFQRIQGSLNSFFRPNSKKVFVFVTDDNSGGATGGPQYDQFPALAGLRLSSTSIPLIENEHYIKESTFRDRMERAFGNQVDFKVFGFVSLGRTLSPCSNRESTEYSSLITATSGQVFNICDTDWTAHFRNLTDSIVNFANNEFVVDNSRLFKALRKVVVNGSEVPSASFVLRSGKVVLDPEYLKNLGTYRVEIEFEKWK